jgi:hypothetical protein
VFNWRDAPEWAQDSLRRYADHGIPTGDCLRAVLANDLMAAFSRADDNTGRYMAEIVAYVYNQLPSNCHGSYEIVDAWLRKHHERRENEEKERMS